MIKLPESCFSPPRFTGVEDRFAPGVKALLFDSVAYRGKPTRVFAWLGLPEGASPEHPVPGMVLVHGGLGTAFPGWVRYWNALGFAAIAMDTCGAMPSQEEIDQRGCSPEEHWPHHAEGGPAGWGNFAQSAETPEEQWCFHALCAVIGAHSLLRSTAGVDPEKIGITGVSWGGVLSCLAAGNDPRFKLAMPVYGCGCFNRESRLCPHRTLPDDNWLLWRKLWDPCHALANAHQPFLWLTGTNDSAFPLSMLMPSFAIHAGENYPVIVPDLPHTHGPVSEEAPELGEFAGRFFAGTALPEQAGMPERHGESLVSRLTGQPEEIAGAALHYTRATGFWSDRLWNECPARIDRSAGTVSAALPEYVSAAFFSITTSAGTRRTSEVLTI